MLHILPGKPKKETEVTGMWVDIHVAVPLWCEVIILTFYEKEYCKKEVSNVSLNKIRKEILLYLFIKLV